MSGLTHNKYNKDVHTGPVSNWLTNLNKEIQPETYGRPHKKLHERDVTDGRI